MRRSRSSPVRSATSSKRSSATTSSRSPTCAPAGVTPLAEVKSELEGFLQDQERDKQQQAYVEGLKKQAKIEIVAPKK